MKTRLLWALILSVGSAALYLGLVRPDVPTDSKRIRDYLEKDPAAQPAIKLPPLVVSESRLPDIPREPTGPSPISHDAPTPDQSTVDLAAGTPVAKIPTQNAALKEAAAGAREAGAEIKK